MVRSSCVSHERLYLKPCRASVRIRWVSACLMMLLQTMCSRSLHMTEVKETGRYFSGRFFSPFLKTGATLAVFQSFEITTLPRETGKKTAGTGAISAESSISNLVGISSGDCSFVHLQTSKKLQHSVIIYCDRWH